MFSDEDLKRLKEDMQGNPEEDIYRGKKNILCFDEMNSLLARLEAAEAIVHDELIKNGMAYDDPKLEAWRKAAGK